MSVVVTASWGAAGRQKSIPAARSQVFGKEIMLSVTGAHVIPLGGLFAVHSFGPPTGRLRTPFADVKKASLTFSGR